MSLSPTFPSLYKYGFATSRAADLLSKGRPAHISPEQREVFSACKDLLEKIIKGEGFLIGPPGEVHNLRPEDVEIFTYVLDTDSAAQGLLAAGPVEAVRDYFQRILETFELLTADPPRDVEKEQLARTLNFVSTIADSLIETARESLRRRQAEESSPAFYE